MEDIRITPRQLKEIRHALGGEIKIGAFRNHFCTGDECSSWNELVEIGFATKRDMGALGGISYFVTEKAIKSLRSD